MLVHPSEQLLAIRPSTKEIKNAVRWMKISDDSYCPRLIRGAAYLGTLYKIFGWNIECRYRVRGVRRMKDNETVVIFDMRETEVFIPDETAGDYFTENVRPLITGTTNNFVAFPPAWAGNFGYNYYRHAQARELAAIDRDGTWNIAVEAQPFIDGNQLNVTSTDDIASNIKQIINEIEQGGVGVGNTR